MPPRATITSRMVAEAAFNVIREKGHENLSVRTIAERLGCSTQPVLYSYRSIDEIREVVYEIADEYHSKYILPRKEDDIPFMAMGLNYVRFGYEENNLFRFLFQTDKFAGINIEGLKKNPALSDVLDVIADGLRVSRKQAADVFLTFFCVAHGMASLLANNSMEYDEKQCKKMLENVFFGMATKIAKKDK